MINKCKYCYLGFKKNGEAYVVFFNDRDAVKIEEYEKLIYDVEWSISEDNLMLYIYGVEDESHYVDGIKYLSELKHTVQKECIRYDKGITIFGKTFFDTPCYVKGWYRTEPFKKVRYILKNYTIKEVKI